MGDCAWLVVCAAVVVVRRVVVVVGVVMVMGWGIICEGLVMLGVVKHG